MPQAETESLEPFIRKAYYLLPPFICSIDFLSVFVLSFKDLGSEGGFSLDLRSAYKKLKAVTPEK